VKDSFERLIPYVSQSFGLSQDELVRSYRPAMESELPNILAFRRLVNDGMWWDDRAFVEWRYFSRKTSTGESPYWIFVWNGEVVGACGLEPVSLVVDGVPLEATRTLDIMVRPDLDGRGLGAFMNLVLFRHFPITMVTGSNAKSHQMLMRMFHHVTDLKFWKFVIHARSVVENRVSLGPFTPLMTSSINLILAVTRLRHRVAPPEGCSIREIDTFDSRVVELSKMCELPGRVLVRRSDDYLNWRFVHNPRCRYRILGAFRGTRLEAYVVTRLNVARPNPRREAEIVDWLAAPVTDAGSTVLPALIQAGTDGLQRDGAELVSCAAVSRDLAPLMEAVGFRFRPGERLPFFVRAADASLQERLSSADSWFLTRGDVDVE
jgi:hypothetical protein